MNTPRCLSTLQQLDEEGYSARARARLSDRRKLPSRLSITRSDIPAIRVNNAGQMSISGVQDKISLKLHRGRLEPTDVGGHYILKPVPGTELPDFHADVPANEHVTMQLAEQVFGIRTAANGLIRLADNELAYLTRRFDRDWEGNRTAQEDFCQLMQHTPDLQGQQYKYNSSYQELGETLRRYCAAYAVEVEELFRRIVFSYAIGNGDAHLKNFSLVQAPAGDYKLSPAYDLLSSSLHLPNESRLALDLFADDEISAGAQREGFETGLDFVELASRYRMRPSRAKAIVDAISDERDNVIDLVERSFLSPPAIEVYLNRYDDRIGALSM